MVELVKISCEVRVGEYLERFRGVGFEYHSLLSCSCEVTCYVFDGFPMNCFWVFAKSSTLVDGKTNIWSRALFQEVEFPDRRPVMEMVIKCFGLVSSVLWLVPVFLSSLLIWRQGEGLGGLSQLNVVESSGWCHLLFCRC